MLRCALAMMLLLPTPCHIAALRMPAPDAAAIMPSISRVADDAAPPRASRQFYAAVIADCCRARRFDARYARYARRQLIAMFTLRA